MEKNKFIKLLPIICCIIGLIISLKGFYLGILDGLQGIGVIFILPTIFYLL